MTHYVVIHVRNPGDLLYCNEYHEGLVLTNALLLRNSQLLEKECARILAPETNS